MSNMLIFAIIAMILALTMYSVGVWGEKIIGRLKPVHLLFFWIGFAFDTAGTTAMSVMAKSFTFDVHGITGLLAIILMAFHAIWASVVLLRRQENAIKQFHRFSLAVWGFWLIPFVVGMIMAMSRT